MGRLPHHYFDYRRLGFGRMASLRLAWIVATA